VTLFDEAAVEATAPVGPSFRVRMTVAYDGRGFRGFADQAGVKTVAGDLKTALAKVLGHAVDLACAGRTDAGVHARGQVITFDALGEPADVDLEAVKRSLTKMLGPAIVVTDAAVAAPEFHARFSATGRRYRYTILNRPDPDPFLAATSWHVEAPLDVRAMELACDPLIGEHDFTSFCRKSQDNGSLTRLVRDAHWEEPDEGVLRFHIEASAFCQQMVRSVVGTMVDVGRGKTRAGEVASILRARDRSAAGAPAPPHGLCLWEVMYGG
jgi:tRNA pseudouridine38-40 synthase